MTEGTDLELCEYLAMCLQPNWWGSSGSGGSAKNQQLVVKGSNLNEKSPIQIPTKAYADYDHVFEHFRYDGIGLFCSPHFEFEPKTTNYETTEVRYDGETVKIEHAVLPRFIAGARKHFLAQTYGLFAEAPVNKRSLYTRGEAIFRTIVATTKPPSQRIMMQDWDAEYDWDMKHRISALLMFKRSNAGFTNRGALHALDPFNLCRYITDCMTNSEFWTLFMETSASGDPEMSEVYYKKIRELSLAKAEREFVTTRMSTWLDLDTQDKHFLEELRGEIGSAKLYDNSDNAKSRAAFLVQQGQVHMDNYRSFLMRHEGLTEEDSKLFSDEGQRQIVILSGDLRTIQQDLMMEYYEAVCNRIERRRSCWRAQIRQILSDLLPAPYHPQEGLQLRIQEKIKEQLNELKKAEMYHLRRVTCGTSSVLGSDSDDLTDSGTKDKENTLDLVRWYFENENVASKYAAFLAGHAELDIVAADMLSEQLAKNSAALQPWLSAKKQELIRTIAWHYRDGARSRVPHYEGVSAGVSLPNFLKRLVGDELAVPEPRDLMYADGTDLTDLQQEMFDRISQKHEDSVISRQTTCGNTNGTVESDKTFVGAEETGAGCRSYLRSLRVRVSKFHFHPSMHLYLALLLAFLLIRLVCDSGHKRSVRVTAGTTIFLLGIILAVLIKPASAMRSVPATAQAENSVTVDAEIRNKWVPAAKIRILPDHFSQYRVDASDLLSVLCDQFCGTESLLREKVMCLCIIGTGARNVQKFLYEPRDDDVNDTGLDPIDVSSIESPPEQNDTSVLYMRRTNIRLPHGPGVASTRIWLFCPCVGADSTGAALLTALGIHLSARILWLRFDENIAWGCKQLDLDGISLADNNLWETDFVLKSAKTAVAMRHAIKYLKTTGEYDWHLPDIYLEGGEVCERKALTIPYPENLRLQTVVCMYMDRSTESWKRKPKLMQDVKKSTENHLKNVAREFEEQPDFSESQESNTPAVHAGKKFASSVQEIQVDYSVELDESNDYRLLPGIRLYLNGRKDTDANGVRTN